MTRSSSYREGSGIRHEGSVPRHVVIVALVVALTVLTSIAITPVPATAGDSATTLDFDPDEVDADPGETVTVDVTMSDHGDLYGNGVAEFAFTVVYDADVVTLTDVDHDPWLDDGTADVDTDVDVDEEVGSATITEERDPVGDGVEGSGTVATLTFTVAEDAEPTNAVLAFEDASVVLSSDWPQGVFDSEATIYVDGGDASDDGGGDPDGVTLAEDGDGDDTGEDGGGDDADQTETTGAIDDPDSVDDETPPGTDDSIPGFDVTAALAAVAVGTVLVLIVVRRREL